MPDDPRRPRPVSDGLAKPEPVRPRSVREGMPGEGAPPEIETGERVIEFADARWTVRSVGRARVRSGAPLLQLVFRPEAGEELEALVVGRTLADLPETALSEALRGARPCRPVDQRAPFFEGTRQAGGRGRG